MVLSCRNLHKAFGGRPAVTGLSFDGAAGEAYGLLGPNGAGKTTTIRMACGLLAPDRGRVAIAGDPAPAGLGYVPRVWPSFPGSRSGRTSGSGRGSRAIPRRERPDRIAEALTAVGLTGRASDRIERCSGGMQRRLNLAIALVHRPALLVLDEPTVGVDAQSRAAILAAPARLRDGGTAILYTSHYMDEVQRLCDRVGVIDRGRMVEEGTPDGLLAARPELTDLEGLYLELTGRELRD